tara:strand:+ start:7224 stop:10427 length:3204 start_codon:yes stop_codon:yes gene_type:complete
MKLVDFAIRNPVSVSVWVLFIALFAIVSMLRLPIQLAPDVEKPEVTVETAWFGASPQEVEREIIDEQEEELRGVEGLEKMFSESSDGSGRIVLRFPAGTDMDTALLRVDNRLNQVEEYPIDVDKPVITSADVRGSAIGWFIVEPLQGNSVDIQTMRNFVEDRVKPRFERVPGVAISNVYGGKEREIQVLVDPAKLAARAVTILQLAQAVDRENRNYSGGDFDEGKRSYVVRTVGEYPDPKAVENVIIAQIDGAPVYVRDVGIVRVGYKDPQTVVREMGRTSIAVNAIREIGANILDTMDGLKEALSELNEGALDTQGLHIYQVYDETVYVNSSLDLVKQNLVLGSLLAVMVLFLFLRTGSSTLVVGVAIPISIMGTFIMLWVLGRNLNVVSLAGMTFAAGMLVDNAIVVLENIYRHRESGKSLFQSAYDGTVEVWGAVLASTLTTIAVFVPIIFVEEQAGQLFRDIAIAISAGVGLSLLVSILVVPTLSARILTTSSVRGDGKSRDAVLERGSVRYSTTLIPDKLAQLVYWLCGGIVRRVALVAGLIILAIGTGFVLLPKAEYLPEGNRNLVMGVLLPPPGYNTDEFIEMGKTIETVLAPHWEAEPGSPEEAALDGPSILNFFYVARGRQVFLGGRTNDPSEIRDLIPLYRKATRELPGVIPIIKQRGLFERGLAGGRTIEIEITGPDLNILLMHGSNIFRQVKALIPSAQVQPVPSLDLGSPEVQVVLKRDRAADVQMTNQELGFTVDALVDGARASDFQFEGDEIDLTIRGEDQYATRTQDLAHLPLYAPGGQLTTLGAIAEIDVVAGPEQINHIEQKRAIMIRVVPPDEMPIEAAMELIDEQVIVPLEAGGTLGRLYELTISGTADDLTLTYQALKWNFLLALIITYLLMASLFESFLYPFVIIFSVPLAAAGGFIGLFLVNNLVTYQALDVLTMLGFIILIGVVVNNAILIVHQALNLMYPDRVRGFSEDPKPMGKGLTARDAISESVRIRVRPIFMSMLTTVFGLLPLIVSTGPGSELYRGIGSVVLGGLMVSTIFTLLLVPSLFSLALDVRRKWSGVLASS